MDRPTRFSTIGVEEDSSFDDAVLKNPLKAFFKGLSSLARFILRLLAASLFEIAAADTHRIVAASHDKSFASS